MFSDAFFYVRYRFGRKLFGHATVGNGGERPNARKLMAVRPDHYARYLFALRFLKKSGLAKKSTSILDFACGVGYGTKVLATGLPKAEVWGYDISDYAIDFAKEYWSGPKNANFSVGDAEHLNTQLVEVCDAIVSFETIEHVSDPNAVLENFFKYLDRDGILILSFPNEEALPFSKEKFPYHMQHFTAASMKSTLEKIGFAQIDVYSQKGRYNYRVNKGDQGEFLVITCRKM